MANREKLHHLVDMLPQSEWATADRLLHALVETGDPFARALADAPEDDEPESDEERAAVTQARREVAHGEVLSHGELCRELGLSCGR